jgi:hypothetical protein
MQSAKQSFGNELSFKTLERETGFLRELPRKFSTGELTIRLDTVDKLAVSGESKSNTVKGNRMTKTRAGYLGGADPDWADFQSENHHPSVVYYRRTYNSPYKRFEPGTPVFLCRRGEKEVSLNLFGYFAEHHQLSIDASWEKYERLLGAAGLKEFRQQAHRILDGDEELSVAKIDNVRYFEPLLRVSVAGLAVIPGVLQSGKWLDSPEVEGLLESISHFNTEGIQTTPSDFYDTDDDVSRKRMTTYRILRDTQLSRQLKQRHHDECQLCGHALPMRGLGTYSEAHHIKPLGKPHNGPDIEGNILVLCPNHHAQCDYGAIRLDLASLKTADGHQVDGEYIDYHNSHIFNGE